MLHGDVRAGVDDVPLKIVLTKYSNIYNKSPPTMASPSEMIGWECGTCTYTNDCRKYDKDGKPLGTAPGKSSNAGKPHKKFGGDKQLAYMTAMFESIQKGLKKQR